MFSLVYKDLVSGKNAFQKTWRLGSIKKNSVFI